MTDTGSSFLTDVLESVRVHHSNYGFVPSVMSILALGN